MIDVLPRMADQDAVRDALQMVAELAEHDCVVTALE